MVETTNQIQFSHFGPKFNCNLCPEWVIPIATTGSQCCAAFAMSSMENAAGEKHSGNGNSAILMMIGLWDASTVACWKGHGLRRQCTISKGPMNIGT